MLYFTPEELVRLEAELPSWYFKIMLKGMER